MSKESTNVELEPIIVDGGEIISDFEKSTEIPPKGKLKIESKKREEDVIIKLSGPEWPPRETAKEEKDEGLGLGE